MLAETTPDSLRRWLPFEIINEELIHYALNKTLRPFLLPATERELFIEGAFGREALRVLRSELNREAPSNFNYNRLIGVGGPLVNVPLWQTALLLLDGLQPDGSNESGLVELDLDFYDANVRRRVAGKSQPECRRLSFPLRLSAPPGVQR